jgi:hypothetical protein
VESIRRKYAPAISHFSLFTLEDLDLDLDQSDRIARRIAHGVYRITHNRQVVGEELWGIFGLLGGGYRLMAEIDSRWPVPNQQRARLDLDADWLARRLWVQMDAEGKRRIAHYVPSGAMLDIEVYEESLRYAEANRSRAQKDQPLQLAPAAKAKRVFEESSVYDEDHTFLDFGSTLFNFAHLKRLNLRPGGKAQMKALVVAQPSLEPLPLAQTYTYVRDEQITALVQPFMLSRRYLIEEHTSVKDAPNTTLWTDEHGVAVKQEVLLGQDTHGCELTSYQWAGE